MRGDGAMEAGVGGSVHARRRGDTSAQMGSGAGGGAESEAAAGGGGSQQQQQLQRRTHHERARTMTVIGLGVGGVDGSAGSTAAEAWGQQQQQQQQPSALLPLPLPLPRRRPAIPEESGRLPKDVLDLVLSFVAPRELFRLDRCCRLWRRQGRQRAAGVTLLDLSGCDRRLTAASLEQLPVRCGALRELKLGGCARVVGFAGVVQRLLSRCPALAVVHACGAVFGRASFGVAPVQVQPVQPVSDPDDRQELARTRGQGASAGALRFFFRRQLDGLCGRLNLVGTPVALQTWRSLCRIATHPTLAPTLLVAQRTSACHVLLCTLYAVCKTNAFFVTWEEIATSYGLMLREQVAALPELRLGVAMPDFAAVLWRPVAMGSGGGVHGGGGGGSGGGGSGRSSGRNSLEGEQLSTPPPSAVLAGVPEGREPALEVGTIGEFYERCFVPSVAQLLDTVCRVRSPSPAPAAEGGGSGGGGSGSGGGGGGGGGGAANAAGAAAGGGGGGGTALAAQSEDAGPGLAPTVSESSTVDDAGVTYSTGSDHWSS